MPINYKRYPPDWQARRQRILHRAGNKCECCGVDNHAHGYWIDDRFVTVKEIIDTLEETGWDMCEDIPVGKSPVKIILTVAHLDWDETNWNVQDDRLQAMCQRCHFAYDRNDNKLRRQNGKHYKDIQQTLF